jgi:hypothetical protein
MASHRPMLNSDPPESLGDADLLTTLLAAAKVKQPRATANALLAEYGSFAEALGGATGSTSKQLPTWRQSGRRHYDCSTASLKTDQPCRRGLPFSITCEPSWRSNHANSSGCCSWTSATT